MSETLGLLVKKQISWFLLQTFRIRIAEGAMQISILSRYVSLKHGNWKAGTLARCRGA